MSLLTLYKKKGVYEEKNRWIAIIVNARTKEKQ
jgi:hypothetical protein